MKSMNELTIVIPAKNEEKMIGTLLTSLTRQDYPLMPSTKVYLADANSTDATAAIVLSFADRLDVEVIPGGLPSAGRNNGARRANTPYVLFVDADIELADSTLVRRAVELMKRRDLHCVTTNISCPTGTLTDRLLYSGNNLMQRLSRLYRPFSTGMFMLFNRTRFQELGGFNERVAYAEDYMLSKQVARNKFGIVRSCVLTTNRRFKRMGYFPVVRLFVRTALNTWNDSFFLRDHKYWESKA